MNRFLPTLLFLITAVIFTIQAQVSSLQSTLGRQHAGLNSSAFLGGKEGAFFLENHGQWGTGAELNTLKYKAHIGAMDVFLSPQGVSYGLSYQDPLQGTMQSLLGSIPERNPYFSLSEKGTEDGQLCSLSTEDVRIGGVQYLGFTFVGANPNPEIISETLAQGYANFYLATCPQGVLNVPMVQTVRYKNIYPNIDMICALPDKGGFEYTFEVRPGGNPNDIRLRYWGVEPKLSEATGTLTFEIAQGQFNESIPAIYQLPIGLEQGRAPSLFEGAGEGLSFLSSEGGKVAGAYSLISTNTIGFTIADYDPSRTLIIDPWATYYGGSGGETAWGMATDALDNVLITGNTSSANFPIGASAGNTTFQANKAADANTVDIFIVKLSPTGQRLWATYYGGSAVSDPTGRGTLENAFSIATDNQNNCIIGGHTASTNFPVSVGAFQTVNKTQGGGTNGIVIKLSPTGTRVWATYYGGISASGLARDIILDLAIDDVNDIAIVGVTNSESGTFPLVAPYRSSRSSSFDGFIAKLNGTDGYPQFSTYYGATNANNYAHGVDFDSNGDIIATGETRGTNFPVSVGAFQTTKGLDLDAFLVKMRGRTDVNGIQGQMVWSTYLGGDGVDQGYSVACTREAGTDIIYVAGRTSSTDVIATAGSFQSAAVPNTPTGGLDYGFIQKFGTAGNRIWGTYLGANGGEHINEISVDPSGTIAFIGRTSSSNLPVSVHALQKTYGGAGDAFFGKINPSGTALSCLSYYGGSQSESIGSGGGLKDPISLALSSTGHIYLTGSTTSPNLSTYNNNSGTYQQNYAGNTDAFLVQVCSECGNPKVALTAPKEKDICPGTVVNLSTDVGHIGTLDWSTGDGNVTSISTSPAANTEVIVTATLGNCSIKDTAKITISTLLANAGPDQNIVCSQKANLLATATGGESPYSYQWRNGPATAGYNNVGSGRYYVTVSDGLGCSYEDSVDVLLQPGGLSLSLTASPSNICLGENISLSPTVSGGTAPYTYAWNADASSLTGVGPHTVTPAMAGTNTYTLTVTDNNGCEIEQSSTVNVRSLPTLSATVSKASCNSSNGQVILGSSDGTGGPYTYSFNGSGFTGTTTYTGLAAGDYVAIVRDAFCQSTPVTINISNNGGPSNFSTMLTPDTCRTGKGKISISGITDGTAPYQTKLGTGSFSTATTYAGLVAGSYTVSIRDNLGCLFSKNINLTNIDILPVVSITGNTSICKNESSTLTASATGGTGFTYSWNTGETSVSINKAPASTATYSVTVNNAQGCNASKSQSVTVKPLPDVILNPAAQSICSESQASINISSTISGSSFAWTSPTVAGITGNAAGSGALIAQALSNSTHAPLSIDYIVIASHNGCTGAAQNTTVTVKPLPDVILNPSNQSICSNQSTAISMNSSVTGSTFNWTTASVPNISGNTAGSGASIVQTLINSTQAPLSVNYMVRATNNGCTGIAEQVIVAVKPLPDAIVTPSSQYICSDDLVVINLSSSVPGSSFDWSTAAIVGISGNTAGTGANIKQKLINTSNNLLSVNYVVNAINDGCTGTAQMAEVFVKPLPVLVTSPNNPSVNSPDTTICVNTSTALHVNGADSYAWAPANLLQTTTGAQVQTITLGMGQYTFTVTGTKDGCPSSKDIAVLVLDEIPPPTVAGNQNICKGEGVTLVATTSINPAQFFWYKDSTLQQIIIDQATLQTGPLFTNDTTFYTNILYGNCASGLTYFSINIKSLPQIVITGNTPICSGDKLNLTASGGKEYRWYTGPNDTISNKSVLDAIATENTTTYYVLVKDSACASIDTVQVQINPLPAVNAGTSVGICKAQQIQLGTAQQAGISYRWQPATNLNTPTLAQPTFTAKQVGRTVYTLTATYTATGCNQSDNLQVDVYELPTARIDLPADVLCNDRLINLKGSGGLSTQDSYAWLKDGQVFAYSNLAAIVPSEERAAYVLRVTTVEGCEDTAMLYLRGEDCEASDVYLPDMFTPNGDGDNDELQILYKQGILSADVSIFDRWGSLIYRGTKESEPWNGTVDGHELPEGLYVYIINLKTSKKSFNKIGTIAIGR